VHALLEFEVLVRCELMLAHPRCSSTIIEYKRTPSGAKFITVIEYGRLQCTCKAGAIRDRSAVLKSMVLKRRYARLLASVAYLQ